MTLKHVQSSTTTVSEIERTTMKRVALRIVPFLMLCFLINFIDRINVGMAALTMNHDIGLKPTELAFGVSLFFVAYVTFGVPSNLALERVGARRWLALIMVGWGVVSMATVPSAAGVAWAKALRRSLTSAFWRLAMGRRRSGGGLEKS